MSERQAGGRLTGILGVAHPTQEGDTATSFELFFDLVYVFAATQVTDYSRRGLGRHLPHVPRG